jgi:general secretion pathway protein G
MQRDTTRGFTLIELMVIVSILGVLAATILVPLNNARTRAQKAKARAELIQIIRAADLARVIGETTLIGVTGNGCSACGTESDMLTSLANISTRSGVPGVSNIRRDPWGGTYLIDENEGEFNSSDCRRDSVYASAEPDISTQYLLDYQSAYCKANPVGTSGWQIINI